MIESTKLSENTKPKLTLFFVVIIAFLSYLLFFVNGLHNSHDIRAHVLWFEHFTSQSDNLLSYPRFLIDANHGFGSPAFYYYPALPYLLLNALNQTLSVSVTIALPLTSFLAVLIGGGGVFKLSRQLGSHDVPAVLCSGFYILSPYLYLIDTVFRFSFAEIFVIGLLPYLFLRYRETYKLTLISALVLLSHPPTSLLVLPFAYLWQWMINRKSLVSLVLGGTISVLMTSFYTFPALLIPNPSMDVMWELYSVDRSYIDKSIDISAPTSFQSVLRISTWLVFFGAVALFLKSRESRVARWAFAFCLLAFFMMLSYSSFVYDLVAVYEKIQFRWRWNSLLLICFTILLSFALNKSHFVKAITIVYMGSALMFPIIISSFGSMYFFSESDLEEIIQANVEVPEYRFNRSATDAEPFAGSEGLLNGKTPINALRWSADSVIFEADFKAGDIMLVRRNAFHDYESVEHNKYRVSKTEKGLIQISVLKKVDKVEIHSQKFTIEKISAWISIVSCVFFVFFSIWTWNREVEQSSHE